MISLTGSSFFCSLLVVPLVISNSESGTLGASLGTTKIASSKTAIAPGALSDHADTAFLFVVKNMKKAATLRHRYK